MDLRNLVDGSSQNYFTLQLLRLIMKADTINIEKLRKVYPVEVRSIEIFRKLDHTDETQTKNTSVIDYKKVVDRAYEEVG